MRRILSQKLLYIFLFLSLTGLLFQSPVLARTVAGSRSNDCDTNPNDTQCNKFLEKPPFIIKHHTKYWIKGYIQRNGGDKIDASWLDLFIYKKNPDGTWGDGKGNPNNDLCKTPAFVTNDLVYCWTDSRGSHLKKCPRDCNPYWCPDEDGIFSKEYCLEHGQSYNCYSGDRGQGICDSRVYWFYRNAGDECGDYRVVVIWGTDHSLCNEYTFYDKFDFKVISSNVPCAPPAPTNIQICFERTQNGTATNDPTNFSCQNLSTDPNTPTKIHLPEPGEHIYLKTNAVKKDYTCGNRTNQDTIYYQFTFDSYQKNTDKTYTSPVDSKVVFQTNKLYIPKVHSYIMDSCTNKPLASSDFKGYVKFDSPPQIISITPNTGVSGTYTDDDNLYSCSDHNPQTYTVRYKDLDGVSDISSIGLWIGAHTPSISDIRNSVHQIARRGSEIDIYARGIIPSTGKCANRPPAMQLRIYRNGQWKTIRTITGISNQLKKYTVYLPFKTVGKYVEVRFANNCDDTNNHTTTDLQIERVIVDGRSYKSTDMYTTIGNYWNGSTCVNGEKTGPSDNILRCCFAYFRYYDTPSILPQSTWIANGLRYDNTLPNTCSGSSISCEGNYLWDLPTNTHGYIVPSTNHTCTALSGVQDLYNNCNNNNSSAIITLTNLKQVNSQTIDATWRVSYLNNSKNFGNNLNLYGNVFDAWASPTPWNTWRDIGDWHLDLIPPEVKVLSIKPNWDKIGHIDVEWKASDNNSNLKTAYMRAVRSKAKKNTKIGINGSPLFYMPLTNTDNVWNDMKTGNNLKQFLLNRDLNNQAVYTNTEDIDLGFNDGGSISFWPAAVDNACNFSGPPSSSNEFKLWTAWIATQGGLVAADKGPDFSIPQFPNHELVSPQVLNGHPVWGPPYSAYKDWLDITTEGLDLKSAVDTDPLTQAWRHDHPFVLEQYHNRLLGQDWYDLMSKSAKKRLNKNPNTYTEKILTSSNISGNLSSICTDANKRCILRHNGDFTINSDFVCDRTALFLIDGDLTVNPDTFLGNDIEDGCIFVVHKNIIFGHGSYKTNINPSDPDNSYISYDVVHGFFIATGTVQFPSGDVGKLATDGIKINGSLLALGGDTTTNSILLNRSLGFWGNGRFPAVDVHFDPRYIKIANYFIVDKSVIKVMDTGFKAY